MESDKKKKIIVAMSGGVDSSVAAALLKKQGYFVVGVFMKFWQETLINAKKNADWRGKENRCCSDDAYETAKTVCAKLDIPFRVLNCAKQFKKIVVDYFIFEYKAGRTPNPCVVCNEKIKFKLLLETAKKWGMDYVATGHYARKRELRIQNSEFRTPIFKLFTAKDKEKDQSYFLYNLTQKQLRNILFPLGDYTKIEARKMAKRWGLSTARRSESFEVCFVPDKVYPGQHRRRTADFLARHIKMKPGKIVNEKNQIIGEHKGLLIYTIGQRHGLSSIKGAGPFYVVGKNLRKNELIVVNNPRSPLLFSRELVAKKINWILGKYPKLPLKCQAKIRYRQPLQSCRLEKFEILNSKLKTIRVIFNKPQRAVTSGQSIVFYKGEEVLGGGVII